ncbi:ATP-binding protein [Cytobacillus oceanisediminis]|uniref:histidine kinase n=1 Tax=Cytobacillus oceanisediminis 2691 TaxID=1196031 RepID=A0A169FRD8_9BACI|nr:ATP-binding protein [Cytobacillus oceanisediminis]AND40531.1 PAS domain-containing sensor histidine kinase [Cytobacillus oceanisediminis 2691]MCM3401004.1 ATP-binding protein [Cytobacillus oceanisediminis]
MSSQNEYIGKKIKKLHGGIFKDSKSLNDEKYRYCNLQKQLGSIQTSEVPLFIYVGELFISSNEKNKNNLITFVDDFGRKLIHSRVSLEQSINFVYLTRCSIMDLLEQELREKSISINTFFESIKILEYLYQLISKTLLNCYNEELLYTKFALDESNQDLKITLRELADLQKALNEATIFSITDRDDRISYVNEKFCDLYKYTREELIGKKHDIFCSDFHPPSFFNHIWETIKCGEVWKGEILNKAKDGTKYWLDTTIVPFVDLNGERYQHICIQYDITEKKSTEETLSKTEKLSMIGELAAGIAHEIRNPLTTIRGFVQLLTENGKVPYFVETILDEIERISFIVNEFMIFAKPHSVYFSEFDVKNILGSVISFLEPEALLKNVRIKYEFPSEDIVFTGEKNQLKQVFINLIKNSIEAMPTGGNIYVSIDSTAHHILIKIKDEGVGIGEEHVKRLGEPFFTTKHNGNGLGLMVSYKIIQNHKGTINVKSKLNQGTSFIITFNKKTKKEAINL